MQRRLLLSACAGASVFAHLSCLAYSRLALPKHSKDVDARELFQSAIDKVAAEGGGTVQCYPGARYVIGPSVDGWELLGNQRRRVGIRLREGVYLDLNGATLSATPHVDYVLISNATSKSRSDTASSLGVFGGTIDYRHASEKGTSPALAFYGVRNLRLDALTILHGYNIALDLEDCSEFKIGVLHFRDCVGAAFYAGGAVASGGGAVSDGSIGSISVVGSRDHPSNHGLPGNPILLNAKRVVIGELRAKTCEAGIKITAGEDYHIEKVVFEAGSTQNSGLKIQGANQSQIVRRVRINQVEASECVGSGMFLTWCSEISVGSYRGVKNGLAHKDADVVVGGRRVFIRRLESVHPQSVAILVSTANGRYADSAPDCCVLNAYVSKDGLDQFANVQPDVSVFDGRLRIGQLSRSELRGDTRWLYVRPGAQFELGSTNCS